MTEQDAVELYDAMQEHRNIFPRSVKIEIITREIIVLTPRANGKSRRRPRTDYGVGIGNPERGGRINLWTAQMVDQFMTEYRARLARTQERRSE